MNTTATDAAIEELQQLVEIEEAGYRLVITRHRQNYIGAEPGRPLGQSAALLFPANQPRRISRPKSAASVGEKTAGGVAIKPIAEASGR